MRPIALGQSARCPRLRSGLRRAALGALVGLSISAGVGGGRVAVAADLDAQSRAEAIDGILDLLLRSYVFPDVADAMAVAIRARQQAGEYDEIVNGGTLATMLTEHLQAVCHDLHLRIRHSPEPIPDRLPTGPSPAEIAEEVARNARQNFGFVRVEHLPGNIGYVRLDGFFEATDAAKATATAAMTLLAHVDAIIFDLRENGGGDPAMVAHLSSYLFGDAAVHLNSLYFRPTDTTTEYWTDPEVPGPKNPDAAVYVLTSGRTFSAAEEFTYNLQCQQRATIVGETTGGGAHPGGTERVNDHFMVWLPTGRAINPITGTNWEGTGVVPGVPSPADEARHEAYLLALSHALERALPGAAQEIRDAMRETNRALADIQLEKDDR